MSAFRRTDEFCCHSERFDSDVCKAKECRCVAFLRDVIENRERCGLGRRDEGVLAPFLRRTKKAGICAGPKSRLAKSWTLRRPCVTIYPHQGTDLR